MNDYFVYHGYASPGSYDASENPVYNMTTFTDKERVIAFKRDFEKKVSELGDEATNPIFRVFEGREVTLKEKTKVVDWEFK